jgi:hypothetical protein
MQANQIDKAVEFQRLHTQAGPFVTPNPWDAGSARLLADLGFPALASTLDGSIHERDETLRKFPRKQTRLARQTMHRLRPPDGLAQEMAFELG